jgi:hypothetical protein
VFNETGAAATPGSFHGSNTTDLTACTGNLYNVTAMCCDILGGTWNNTHQEVTNSDVPMCYLSKDATIINFRTCWDYFASSSGSAPVGSWFGCSTPSSKKSGAVPGPSAAVPKAVLFGVLAAMSVALASTM